MFLVRFISERELQDAIYTMCGRTVELCTLVKKFIIIANKPFKKNTIKKELLCILILL